MIEKILISFQYAIVTYEWHACFEIRHYSQSIIHRYRKDSLFSNYEAYINIFSRHGTYKMIIVKINRSHLCRITTQPNYSGLFGGYSSSMLFVRVQYVQSVWSIIIFHNSHITQHSIVYAPHTNAPHTKTATTCNASIHAIVLHLSRYVSYHMLFVRVQYVQ